MADFDLCTLSDYRYLRQGLCMYKSARDKSGAIVDVRYLCLDKRTFDILTLLRLPGIHPVLVDELYDKEPSLMALKKSGDYKGLCWTLASYFLNYLLSSGRFNEMTYVDADIAFLRGLKFIRDSIDKKSVGIFRHRHIPIGTVSNDGSYNVGVVYFRNSPIGLKTLNWWSDAVLHRKYPEYSSCYDQKYLDAFVPMFGEEVKVIDDISHGAPWHWRLYDYSVLDTKEVVVWEGKEQPLVFNHYSRFSYNIQSGTYSFTSGDYGDHTMHFTVFQVPQVKRFYEQYITDLKWVENHWLKGSTL
jgi:hypothetical protein